jgi:flotillin
MPEMTFIIIIGIAVFVIFAIIVGVLKNYRRCPSDKILVIYGKGTGNQSATCVHGGAAFVWPILQDYQYLDLTPFSINIELRGALSKQNIRVDVSSSFTVAISTDGHTMQNAAERLLGLDFCTIQNLASKIILGQLRLIVAQIDVEELNTERERFMDEMYKNVEPELRKIGLKLYNAYINDVREVEASKLSVA